MKAIIRKYVSLVVMLLLLGLVISFLPKEGTIETSNGYRDSISSVKTVSLSPSDLHK